MSFLFPAFGDRCANICNAPYYARKPDELHKAEKHPEILTLSTREVEGILRHGGVAVNIR